MHQALERPDAPPGLIVGLAIVESLCSQTMNGSSEEAADLSTEVCTNPKVANAVLAAAIGVLCHCEKGLSQAAEHMAHMTTDDPETVQKIRQYVADDLGLPVEDLQT